MLCSNIFSTFLHLISLIGSVLEGPEPELLKGIVEGAYNVILAMMADENVSVRDSAAWVVQRMCQLLREAVLQPDRFRNTVVILRENLRGPPRVAANVCWVRVSEILC